MEWIRNAMRHRALGGDAIVGASIGKVALHIALLIVNLVFYLREE